MTVSLARDETVQVAFAEGQRDVIRQDQPARRIFDAKIDVEREMLKDAQTRRDVLALQIETTREIAKDPTYRAQFIAILLDLMKDPAVQSEMKKMIQAALKSSGGSSGGSGGSGSQQATPLPPGLQVGP